MRDAGLQIETWLIGDGCRRLEYERSIAELGVGDAVRLLGVRRDIPDLLGHSALRRRVLSRAREFSWDRTALQFKALFQGQQSVSTSALKPI